MSTESRAPAPPAPRSKASFRERFIPFLISAVSVTVVFGLAARVVTSAQH